MARHTPEPAEFDFRMRGRSHVTRLECFSDCVFAFALTLLVVSLEVPKSFDDLWVAMKGLLAFAFCFAILFGLWSRHHTFFRRYGLEDTPIKGLTACLLFVILGYVYPLKFLSTVVLDFGLGLNHNSGHPMFTPGVELQQVRWLFVLYGSGLFTLSILFFLMYRHALARRSELALTELEEFDTRWFGYENLFQAAVPLTATTLSFVLPGEFVGLAGLAYCLYALAAFSHGSLHGRKRREFIAALTSRAPDSGVDQDPA